ncbi:VOC family protein [Cellulomonas denverensis]|uniref:VOC family protein n=1 Tax=Cellulomonas denverensis TaxID=264297 RepID=A0A7X6QZZ2_9CELL|nr:VOC family protein [Cellulomonas denverensis]NKY23708.1 VOC family protein [Cellulomonas denverensis]GIG26950.1 glyoxalase [Cellulomonas denverensis]
MTISVGMITFDAADATALAQWWAARLGTEASDQSGGEGWFLTVEAPGGTTLGFQRVPDPTPGKNRLHLDITVPDREAAAAEMIAAGATLVATRDLKEMGADFTWTVLADPEGNQFCLAAEEGA